MKVADITREKVRRWAGRELDMGPFLSLFQEYLPVGLKELSTEQVKHVVLAAIGMALYCQKDRRVPHMFRLAFVDNKLSIKHVNGASYV